MFRLPLVFPHSPQVLAPTQLSQCGGHLLASVAMSLGQHNSLCQPSATFCRLVMPYAMSATVMVWRKGLTPAQHQFGIAPLVPQ